MNNLQNYKIMRTLSLSLLNTDDVLRMVFCKVESIVNATPLTPVCFSDAENKSLTPRDFLKPESSESLFLPPVNEKDVYFIGKDKQTKYLIIKRERWVKE